MYRSHCSKYSLMDIELVLEKYSLNITHWAYRLGWIYLSHYKQSLLLQQLLSVNKCITSVCKSLRNQNEVFWTAFTQDEPASQETIKVFYRLGSFDSHPDGREVEKSCLKNQHQIRKTSRKQSHKPKGTGWSLSVVFETLPVKHVHHQIIPPVLQKTVFSQCATTILYWVGPNFFTFRSPNRLFRAWWTNSHKKRKICVKHDEIR